MRRLTLTQEDLHGLNDALIVGAKAMSGAVIYKDVCMDHRPARCILDALIDGEEEVAIFYEDWQIAGPEAAQGEVVTEGSGG